MAELSSQHYESNASKQSAPKDKSCPYCGQAFTSSSLGRHLDLYIKERNPKPPDGLHDIEEIKKIRGCITRRQPRSSLSGRRDSSTPVCTPKGPPKIEHAQDKDSTQKAPSNSRDRPPAAETAVNNYPITPRWDSTGLANDAPPVPREGDEVHNTAGKRTAGQRVASRQVMQKAQLDVRKKLTDAMDTARAAELALRELLCSFRAAKYDSNSFPIQ
jgi:hypothetical protein